MRTPGGQKILVKFLLTSGGDGSYQFLGQDCSFFSSVGRTDTGKSLFCFRSRHSLFSIGPFPITSHATCVTVSVTNLRAEPKLQCVTLHPMTIYMALGNAVWTRHKAFLSVNSSPPTPVSKPPAAFSCRKWATSSQFYLILGYM